MKVQKLVTIDRHIISQERKYPQATGEFSSLLANIALAGKVVSREVNKAGLIEILGFTGDKNVHGERVKKLDVYANKVFTNSLMHSGLICAMASEEYDDILVPEDDIGGGHYAVNIDPLDGSSNIEANVSIGTIFGIHRKVSEGEEGDKSDCLQAGWKLAAAGYILYGSSTMMVYTTGVGVHAFTLDPSVGEFLLSNENLRIPRKGKIVSINNGNYNFWAEGTRQYINYLRQKDTETDRPYSDRYIGSLVADFHRNLLYGGIFLYPLDFKNPEKPQGKLRLLYEAQPLAMLVEQAGGAASDGITDILDIVPQFLHETVPLILGSIEDVEMYMSFVEKFDRI